MGRNIGIPRKDRCSIPQGCPFSMTMVALLFRPWVMLMQEQGVTPRVLADDLLILTHGTGHRARTVKTVEMSIEFFDDIGAKVAENKCFTFASDAPTRIFLRETTWRHSKCKIPNKSSFRDLGSHLNFTTTKNGSTIVKRIKAAKDMCCRLKWLKLTNKNKQKIIMSNIIPAALYGAETTFISDAALASIRTSVAEVIGPKSGKRSIDMVFNLSDTNKELDPKAHILIKRITEMRRMMAKNTECKELISLMISIHNKNGIISDVEGDDSCSQHRQMPDITNWKNDLNEEEENQNGITGPVELLVNELNKYGYAIDPEFNITKVNEPTINLWQMPWQHLRTAICDVVRIQRDKDVSVTRTFLESFGETDHDMIKGILNSFGEKEQRIYKHIASGAMWNAKEIQEISDKNKYCQHCGECVEDSTHILWCCAGINKHRTFNDLTGISIESIPKAILYGIPLALGWEITKPFWHKHGECNVSKIGRLESQICETRECEIKQMLDQNGINRECNARQAIMQLKAEEETGETGSLPYSCSRLPTENINVYSDGSWLTPTKRFLSLGGAGVWWPSRTIHKNNLTPNLYHMPLSDGEMEMAYWKQEDDGLTLYIKIGGYTGSSTRTELAAAILAISSHGPINLASDSQAFVNAANKLIKSIRKCKDHKIQWRMQSDGDLWEHFHNALKKKSTKAVIIQWTKGHAKQSHIDKGITTLEKKSGNDKADANADLGAKLHSQVLRDTTGWLANKHMQYIAFMKKVVTHIVESYIIHKQLDEIDEIDDVVADKRVFYCPLIYPDEVHSAPLKIVAHLGHFKAYNEFDNKAKDVYGFLENIKVRESDNQTRCITWLELYILYRIRGYRQPIDNPICISHAKATLDKQFAAFKNKVRAVATRVYQDSEQGKWFQPGQIKNENLIGIGITGKHQGPSFNVHVSNEEKKEIAQNLHLLNHSISNVKLDKLINGELKFLPRILLMRGRVEWNANIKELTPPIYNDLESWYNEIENEIKNNKNKKCVMLECNRCHKSDPDYTIKTDIFDVEKRIVCGFCNKSSLSKLWNCPCGTKWFLCEEHKYCTKSITRPIAKGEHEIDSSKDAKKQKLETKTRAQQVMVSHQVMLEQDIAAEKYKTKRNDGSRPKADIVLGDSQLMVKRPRLGPILNARLVNTNPALWIKNDGNSKPNLNVMNLDPTRTKKPRIDGVLHHNGPGASFQPGTSSSSSCT